MTIVNGDLHTRSITCVFQCCAFPKEGHEILNAIHSGNCGHHTGSRSLVAKAFRHCFYSLAAHALVEDIVRRCNGCRKFACQAHVSAQELQMIPFIWLFTVWGLDLVGPFKSSNDKKTHLLVAIDNSPSGSKRNQCSIVMQQRQLNS